jgi:hypothetical protein
MSNESPGMKAARRIARERLCTLVVDGARDFEGGQKALLKLASIIDAELADARRAVLGEALAELISTPILSDDIHELPQSGALVEVQIPFTAAGFKELAIARIEALAARDAQPAPSQSEFERGLEAAAQIADTFIESGAVNAGIRALSIAQAIRSQIKTNTSGEAVSNNAE